MKKPLALRLVAALALRVALLALLAVIAGSSVGCASDCDRIHGWRNEGAGSCNVCKNDRCGTQGAAVLAGALRAPCNTEAACFNGCYRGTQGALSTLDCGCAYNCVRTPACRQLLDSYLACLVTECDPSCR